MEQAKAAFGINAAPWIMQCAAVQLEAFVPSFWIVKAGAQQKLLYIAVNAMLQPRAATAT